MHLYDVHKKYDGIRDAAYHIVYDEWKQHYPNIKLFPITEDALVYSEQVWDNISNINMPDIFYWREIYLRNRNNPRRFDLSIWNGPVLCGMASGRAARKNRNNVTLMFLQGAPWNINPLKGNIAAIALHAFDVFGFLTEKSVTYIDSPLAGAIPLYQKLGFSLASGHRKGKYMQRSITAGVI